MDNFLKMSRDPVWQFVGVLLALIACLFSAVTYYFNQQTKLLDIVTISQTELVEVRGAEEDIEILYKGEPVEQIISIVFKVRNSGDLTIRPEDYVEPITITFPAGTTIVSEDLSNKKPANIDGEIYKIDDQTAALTPMLLNKGDEFFIELLVIWEGGDTTYDVNARIADIPKISRVETPTGSDLFFLILALIFVPPSLIAFGMYMYIERRIFKLKKQVLTAGGDTLEIDRLENNSATVLIVTVLLWVAFWIFFLFGTL